MLLDEDKDVYDVLHIHVNQCLTLDIKQQTYFNVGFFSHLYITVHGSFNDYKHSFYKEHIC